ncbi:MAG TPA: DMT family transporter [Acidobacteriota bacterium]|nr:DMT family transporter [Acidobacteriota bacterium]
MRNSTKADLSLVLVAMFWGTSFVVVKDALAVVPPFWLIFLRFAVASVGVGLLFPGVWRRLDRLLLLAAAIVGLCLFAGFALQTLGLQWTTPAKSAFITGCAVLLVPLFSRLLFGRTIPRPVMGGAFLALCGIYLLARPDDLTRVNLGDLLTFGCAIAFALHIISIGYFAGRVPYQALAVLQIFFTGLAALPFAMALEVPSLDYGIPVFASVLYLGIFCSALAFLIQTHAQQYTTEARTALIFALEPVFAAIFAVVVHQESLEWVEWLGGALIVAGVLMAEVRVLQLKK